MPRTHVQELFTELLARGPDLPDAACAVDRGALAWIFDNPETSHPDSSKEDLVARWTLAAGICRTCPLATFARCREWGQSMPPVIRKQYGMLGGVSPTGRYLRGRDWLGDPYKGTLPAAIAG